MRGTRASELEPEPEYLALARRHVLATVFTDSDDHPSFADITGPFVYALLMRTRADLSEACPLETFAPLAACAGARRDGCDPGGVPRVEPTAVAPAAPRDVFMFFISGAKERAPAAATLVVVRDAPDGIEVLRRRQLPRRRRT